MCIKKHSWIMTIPGLFLVCLLTVLAEYALSQETVNPAEKAALPAPAQPSGETAPAPEIEEGPVDPQTIVIPKEYGTVDEVFVPDSGATLDRVVVHIQDAHCNFEAQINQGKILDGLFNKYGIDVVAMEGAKGEYDLSVFTSIADREIREKVSRYFLKLCKINGAEYYAINSDKEIPLYGVEEKDLYFKNLNSFLGALKFKDTATKYCDTLGEMLNKIKQTVYSPELKALDEKVEAYENKKLVFEDYYRDLVELAGEKLGVQFGSGTGKETTFKNISLFTAALSLEKEITFPQISKETTKLMKQLQQRITKDELGKLLKMSVDMKEKRITAYQYYSFIKKMAGKDLHLKNANGQLAFANLVKYIEYVSINNELDNTEMLFEMDELVEEIKESLFANGDQRTLSRLLKNLKLLRKLFYIEVTKRELTQYHAHKAELSDTRYWDFIKKHGLDTSQIPSKVGKEDIGTFFKTHLPKIEEFYEVATKRDKLLVENTFKRLNETNGSLAVLIVGGLHTRGMMNILKERKVPYLVVLPVITKEDTDNPYLDRIQGKPTPLEQLIETIQTGGRREGFPEEEGTP